MHTLRLFADVARCHSFSQAAVLHGVTQSAASQRVRQLEEKLGVTLLDRSVRPLGLTEAGEAFLAGCDEIIGRYDKLEQRVRAMGDNPSGVVRVVAIYSAGIELLDDLAERFHAERPRITVETDYQKPADVYASVLDQRCDFGILSYPQRWRKVGILPLRDELMAVVCRPDHPLAGQDQLSPQDLSSHEMVTFDTDLPAGRRIRQYLREHGASPRIVHVFDNVDTIRNTVAVTPRFSILPVRTVRREAEAGLLAAVSLTPELTRPIGMIYRRRQAHGSAFSPAAQVFVDYLLEHAGPSVDASCKDAAASPRLIGVRA